MRLSTVAAAAAFAGGLLLLGATPAHAVSTIPINPGSVPATAAGFGSQECTQTGASATRDGWVFVLPGNKGTFVSLTLTFATPGGPVVFTIPTDGGTIATGGGTNKAWLTTPAGWTLVGGSAVINGQSSNGFFVLTHTCPATTTPSPSPSTSPPSTPPTSTSSAAALLATAATSPAGAVVGLLLTGGLLGTGTILALRRRRDQTG